MVEIQKSRRKELLETEKGVQEIDMQILKAALPESGNDTTQYPLTFIFKSNDVDS